MPRSLVPHFAQMALVVVGMGWDRLVIVGLILVGATVLAAIGEVDSSAVIALYTAVLAYTFGRADGAVARERESAPK